MSEQWYNKSALIRDLTSITGRKMHSNSLNPVFKTPPVLSTNDDEDINEINLRFGIAVDLIDDKKDTDSAMFKFIPDMLSKMREFEETTSCMEQPLEPGAQKLVISKLNPNSSEFVPRTSPTSNDENKKYCATSSSTEIKNMLPNSVNMNKKREFNALLKVKSEFHGVSQDIRKVNKVPEAKCPLNGVPESKGAFNGVPDAKRLWNGVPDAKRAWNGVPDTKREWNGVPDAKSARNGVPDAKSAWNGVPDAKRVLNEAPKEIRALNGAPDAKRAWIEVPDAKRAWNGVPDAKRVLNEVPNTKLALNGVPEANEVPNANYKLNGVPERISELIVAAEAKCLLTGEPETKCLINLDSEENEVANVPEETSKYGVSKKKRCVLNVALNNLSKLHQISKEMTEKAAETGPEPEPLKLFTPDYYMNVKHVETTPAESAEAEEEKAAQNIVKTSIEKVNNWLNVQQEDSPASSTPSVRSKNNSPKAPAGPFDPIIYKKKVVTPPSKECTPSSPRSTPTIVKTAKFVPSETSKQLYKKFCERNERKAQDSHNLWDRVEAELKKREERMRYEASQVTPAETSSDTTQTI